MSIPQFFVYQTNRPAAVTNFAGNVTGK